jgi:hypothetical protein
MKPAVVHRYSIPTVEAIELLIGSAAGDAEAWQVRVEGDHILVDLVEPAQVAPPAAPQTPTAGEAPTAQPSPPSAPAPAAAGKAAETEKKGGPNARRAGMMCGEGAFYIWAEVAADKDAAANFIRQRCGVKSRVELDHDPEAAAKFKDLAASYDAWLAGAE